MAPSIFEVVAMSFIFEKTLKYLVGVQRISFTSFGEFLFLDLGDLPSCDGVAIKIPDECHKNVINAITNIVFESISTIISMLWYELRNFNNNRRVITIWKGKNGGNYPQKQGKCYCLNYLMFNTCTCFDYNVKTIMNKSTDNQTTKNFLQSMQDKTEQK